MGFDPEADMVAYLNGKTGTASLVLLTAGANLFKGPVRPVKSGVPAQAVFALCYGGPPALPYMGQSVDDRQSMVQVRIRSGQEAEDTGRQLARDVWQLIQRAPLANAQSQSYTYSLVQQSEPVYLAQDEQGCHEWSLNVVLRWVG